MITAVLNRENTIGSCIGSLSEQTYSNFEHIVQDGGSTDETTKIVEQSPIVDTSFVSEPDNGIYDAINRGIGRASGDIIGVLHSDDMLAHSRVLEKVLTLFEDPNVSGVYGDLDYIAKNDPQKILRKWRPGDFHLTKLQHGWMPPHPTLFLRKAVYANFGAYDVNMKISADYEAVIKYLILGRIKLKYIPEVLVKMRVGGASNGSLKKLYRKTTEDYAVIRRYKIGGLKTLSLKKISKLKQFI